MPPVNAQDFRPVLGRRPFDPTAIRYLSGTLRTVLSHRSPGTKFDIEFEPTHAAASQARQAAREHLDRLTLAPTVSADLELVIAELAANAVEQKPSTPVRLTFDVTASELMLTVANETTGAVFDHRETTDDLGAHGEALAERGWGMGIVDSLTDDLWVDNADGWTSVSCLRHLGPPAR